MMIPQELVYPEGIQLDHKATQEYASAVNTSTKHDRATSCLGQTI
jgi:hypothetical protein